MFPGIAVRGGLAMLSWGDLRIGGRMVYLWRAVDAEGEVLDVLVQSKRSKQGKPKPMRNTASFPIS
jgi:DDE superfamily endonuclease